MTASPKIKEANLWTWLAKAKGIFGPLLFIERVENAASKGTPDVDMMLNGQSAKIELKTVARPARETTPINHGLSPEQISWLYNYRAAGGRAWLLIQVGSGADVRRYLINALYILEFQKPVTEPMLQLFGKGTHLLEHAESFLSYATREGFRGG